MINIKKMKPHHNLANNFPGKFNPDFNRDCPKIYLVNFLGKMVAVVGIDHFMADFC
jgi:hypothetical protein